MQNEAARCEVMKFYAACPDFCDTPPNWSLLTAYLPPEFDHVLRWPTAEELIAAYELAREDGHFRSN